VFDFSGPPRAVLTSLGLASSCLFLLTGCVSSPESQSEALEIEVPAQWQSAATGAEFVPQRWMQDFNDPQLERIMREALEHNFSLMAAQARLDAQLAGTEVGQAEIWPTLGISAAKSDARRNAAAGVQQTPVARTYSASGRFNWEIDLWGKLRNGYRGDLADAEAAAADFEATRLSIAGRTAQAWYSAIEAQQIVGLAQRTLEAFLSNQRIVEEGFERGIGGALEVRLIRANVAAARSAYEAAERSRLNALRNLEVLLGRYPAAEIELAADWPEIDATVPAGLPSELLLRRPDVMSAERALAGAQQRKYEAKKALLPNLEITLTRGTNSTDIAEVLDLDSRRVWSRVWSVSQPLFQGGRLRANLARNEALERQAVASYTQAVLVAFSEVENSLSEQASFARDYEAQRIAEVESVAAEELAWERYESGLADITTALDADRRSINAQRSLIQVTNRRIQSRINLYLALGGGFTFDPPAEP
jgi:outer membrane protein, multidrug efflux system